MAKLSASHRRRSDRPRIEKRKPKRWSPGRFWAPHYLAAFLVAGHAPALSAGGAAPPLSDVDGPMDADTAVAEMDRILAEILNRFSDDNRFIEKLKASQKAWRAYRDAHLEALYPADDKMLAYGSAYRHCRQIALAELTSERIKYLRRWLQGVPEGDVCAGSLPRESQ